MGKVISTPILLLILVIIGLGSASMYSVYETELVIIERLGKFKQASDSDKPLVIEPGLHFKLPLIDSARRFDMRINTLDVKSDNRSSRIVTSEKKDVLVDFFVQWRIKDLALYFTRTGGLKSRAELLLTQNVIDGLRAEFGLRTIKEVVSGERVELMEHLKRKANIEASNKGMEIEDVRIKRIDLPDEVSGAVYDRMRSERERVASEIVATGHADANIIRANAENTVRIMLATAERDSKEIKGSGDAEAIKIYAAAYKAEPDFYEYYRSLEAYRNVLSNKDDLLLIKPDSEFFKYFKQQESKKG